MKRVPLPDEKRSLGLPRKRQLRNGLRCRRKGVAPLVVAAAFLLSSCSTVFEASVPQRDGVLSVPGLSAPVEIVRDRYGVPHITAASDRDLYFAQGFVHAQDRLFQMD
ncbi:MAG TPA: penicillin acylase family protein, partial [Candidatus Deferrimicrobium sp.]